MARLLRKKMTDTERKLWSRVRNNQLGMKFRRQVPIGPYIVDFYCADARLDVELDGSQHYSQRGQLADRRRDNYFDSINIRVVRYPNARIKEDVDGVISDILEHMHRAIGTTRLETPPHEPSGTRIQRS